MVTPARRGAGALRVGLVGYGLGGSTFHAPLIAAVPELELAVVVTHDPERARAVARRFPRATVVSSAEELWTFEPRLDLVAISSPNHTHAPLALAALAAGLHVVVDKPFGITALEARSIADEAGRRGRLAVPFQNRRWDGDYRTVQRLLRDGALGTVHRFESRFERWRSAPKPRWCEPDATRRGEGVLLDLGSHLVDQALVLFGPARSVYAELDARHRQLTVPDDAFLAISHESGVLSHLHASTATAQSGARFTVAGSRASYVKHGLDVQEDALRGGALPGEPRFGEDPPERWGSTGVDSERHPEPTEPGVYHHFYRAVAQALLHDTPPPVTTEEGVAVLEVLDAARRSASERAVVAIRS